MKKRKVSPAKRTIQKLAKAVAAKRTAIAAQKAESERRKKAAVDAAVAQAADMGFNILTPEGKIDKKEARKVAEAAAVEEAAKYGINIRNDKGKISRREARKAARAAQDAREGKPVSLEVARAVSRRDAVLVAKFKAAERQGLSIEQIGGDLNRRDAYTNSEIAALIRRGIAKEIGET